MTAAARVRGSVRFPDYFKVQWWDAVALAWRDIQERYPTEADAHAAAPAGRRHRLMRVTERGRLPVPGSEREARDE